MSTNVVMPQLGESISEGTITRWLKKLGDTVEKDETLFEISTDKVDAEIPSPVAGVLSEIKFIEGATVEVNMVVAVIAGAPELVEAPTDLLPTQRVANHAYLVLAGAGQASRSNQGSTIHCSPLVRRLAREKRADLHSVPATGLGGRITKEDLLGHLSRQGSSVATTATFHSSHDVSAYSAGTLGSSVTEKRDESIAQPAGFPGSTVPLTKMRAIIAQRMLESVQISPHVHTVFKVDMTKL